MRNQDKIVIKKGEKINFLKAKKLSFMMAWKRYLYPTSPLYGKFIN